MGSNIDQHNIEIYKNTEFWNSKRLLRTIYNDFYLNINSNIDRSIPGYIVELGSGIGAIKSVIPDCLTTDLFPNTRIDRIESVYKLSFENKSISNLILFDVFHHIEFLGEAFEEMYRVLNKKGKIILFEPSLSVLGLLIFGLFHHEPLGLLEKIKWDNNADSPISNYYAAQGNAFRLFVKKSHSSLYKDKWRIIKIERKAAISYVLSGGYKGKQLYPENWYWIMKKIDKLFDFFPAFFSTRLLIILEKI